MATQAASLEKSWLKTLERRDDTFRSTESERIAPPRRSSS
jgi:hypothetical protein